MDKTPNLEAPTQLPEPWVEAARIEAEALEELAALTAKPEDAEKLRLAAKGAAHRHQYRASTHELPNA